jgi:inosine-uridine nucleoside N-ribohydrolase
MATPIILDTDPGHDDAIALLLALASPEVEVLGVTPVSGNQTLEKTTTNALKILEFVERTDIPVHVGCDRPLVREQWAAGLRPRRVGARRPGSARAEDEAGRGACRRLHREDVQEREGVVLVPVGPLTNIGLLLARYPGSRSGSTASSSWAARSRRGT